MRHKQKLSIIIDFDITYVGAAYMHSITELSNITGPVYNKITIVKNWQTAHNYYSKKILTTFAYWETQVIV